MLGSIFDMITNLDAARTARRIRRAVIDFAFAGVAFLMGFGFLIAAGFIYTAERYGGFYAALWFGFGFLAISATILIAHRVIAAMRTRRRKREERSDRLRSMATAAAVAAAPALIRSAGWVGTVVIPLAAIAAYVIYQENRRPTGEYPDELDDDY